MKAYLGNINLREVRLGDKNIANLASPTEISPVINFINASGITGSVEVEAIDYLYNALVDANLYNKLWLIYPLIGYDSTKSAVNLSSTSSLGPNQGSNLQFNGNWTFDEFGITSDGSTAWANTFLEPSSRNIGTSVGNTQNFSMGIYSQTTGSQNIDMGSGIGGFSGQTFTNISTQNSSNQFVPGLPRFDGSIFYTGSQVTGAGFYQASHSGTTIFGSINNEVVYTLLNAPNIRNNPYPILIGALWDGNIANPGPVDFSARTYSYAFIGSNLSPEEMITHYEIVQTYNTLLNRAI